MADRLINRITDPNLIFILPAILIGLTIHEFSHALMSHKLGDPTPNFQGRVSLNPLTHIDPVGLIALIFLGFGWGRPVQIDDSYYKDRKMGRVVVSLAGPLSNFAVAILTAIFIRVMANHYGLMQSWVFQLMINILYINVVLGVFNLIPLPPLDGSKLLFELLPAKFKYKYYYTIQQYFPIIIMLLIFTGAIGLILGPLVNGIVGLLL